MFRLGCSSCVCFKNEILSGLTVALALAAILVVSFLTLGLFESIDTLAERYIRAGKTVHIRHLSEECRQLVKKVGNLVEVKVLEDPHYHVADDLVS